MKLSIVTTLFKSAPYIKEFHSRATKIAKQLVEDDYEIVFVNDGSPDNSLDIALELHALDSHLKIIDLSRNFGHHKAMMTGIEHAIGNKVFLIDCDLEEDPEWLIEFSLKLKKDNVDVVYGIQEQRKGNWFERHSGQIFYRLFRLITSIPLPENIVTARLMTRRYVDALVLHKEREVFMAGLWHITGFDQSPAKVKKHSTSVSSYNLQKKVSLFVNSITSFSNAPLNYIFYFGLFISLLAMVFIAYLITTWILDYPLSGWTSIMASIWLLGGIITSSIGVVGIYLSKIFSETKNRPYTIVREIYGHK